MTPEQRAETLNEHAAWVAGEMDWLEDQRRRRGLKDKSMAQAAQDGWRWQYAIQARSTTMDGRTEPWHETTSRSWDRIGTEAEAIEAFEQEREMHETRHWITEHRLVRRMVTEWEQVGDIHTPQGTEGKL